VVFLRRRVVFLGRRGGVSARVRIIGWMLAVLALAVAAVVFLSWQLLSARSDASADAELTHEATKFRAYAGSQAAAPLDTPEELLDLWLRTNLPDTSEAFFTIVDGRAYHRSLGTPPARLDTDLAFVQRISSSTTPQYGWVDSTAGKVRYGVIPVQIGSQPVRAQLVMLEFRDLLAQPLEDATKALALIGVVTLAMAAGACWIVTGRVLAPIRAVRTTAEQIGESDLRRRIDVVGNDDVALLARTFNTMLDRLEVAFVAQREFVDNAGHELRTPITVIRGHLELMSDDPVDREETRALVLDELARMNRMVDNLLVLAKSGRPDFLKGSGFIQTPAGVHQSRGSRGSLPVDPRGTCSSGTDVRRPLIALFDQRTNSTAWSRVVGTLLRVSSFAWLLRKLVAR
jgi:two-component system OmpR family sensor kinase